MKTLFAATASLLLSFSSHTVLAAPNPTSIPFESDTSGALPPTVKASGNFLRSVSWRDANGQKMAVFSETELNRSSDDYALVTRTIYLDLYAEKDGTWTKRHAVREVVRNCQYSLQNEFIAKAVSVTDLDKDGESELSFAYRFVCRGDLGPSEMKLFMLEGRKMYGLRGETYLGPNEEYGSAMGGDYTQDFDAKGAPAPFLSHAKKLWAQYREE